MKKNKLAKTAGALLVAGIIGGTSIASAATGPVNAYDVTYQGKEVYTGYVPKVKTVKKGAVNLKEDSGTAYITATMRNSEGASRGVAYAQRGQRVEFDNTGSVNYEYRLGLVKTNAGTPVRVVGTWSPDNTQ